MYLSDFIIVTILIYLFFSSIILTFFFRFAVTFIWARVIKIHVFIGGLTGGVELEPLAAEMPRMRLLVVNP